MNTDARALRSTRRASPLRRGIVLGALCSLGLHALSLSPIAVLHVRALRRASEPDPSETDFELLPTPPGTLRREPAPTAPPPVAATVEPAPSASAAPSARPSTPPPAPRPSASALARSAGTELANAELTPPPSTPSRGPLHEVAGAGEGLPVVRGDPSSVSAQRARLPNAVRCRDAVAGLWRGHSFNGRRYNWHVFNLRIERDHDALFGAITVRTWDGGPSQGRPPTRCEGDIDYSMRMNASGNILGDEITFGARGPATVTAARCPAMHFAYDPDHFSGTVDTERQEFQSVNNDGGASINDPVLFRRVGCLPGDALPPGE